MLTRPAPDKSGSLKALAKECLDGLYSLTDSALAASKAGNLEDLQTLTADTQQLAVDLGTTIEYTRGEDDPHTRKVVSVLEALCENIYNFYQATASGQIAPMNPGYISAIRSDLDRLSASIEAHILSRKEVLFLPIGSKEWHTMQQLYNDYASQSDTDISVVHLPLIFKDYFGNVTMSDDEILAEEKNQHYPDGLITHRFPEYDLALHCPETIVIQNPYDETNPCLTVPRAFYAKELLSHTDELIYVPIGATAEFSENDTTDQTNLKFYVTAPGVILSDHVYVQSEHWYPVLLTWYLYFAHCSSPRTPCLD